MTCKLSLDLGEPDFRICGPEWWQLDADSGDGHRAYSSGVGDVEGALFVGHFSCQGHQCSSLSELTTNDVSQRLRNSYY